MVDLAGSERQKRSGATGQTFAEMVGNNLALSALGRVVTSLVERDGARAAHVGYAVFVWLLKPFFSASVLLPANLLALF